MQKSLTNRISLSLIVLICLFSGCSDQNKIEKELIIKIEKERLEALVDANMAISRPLYADDFLLRTPDGGIYGKERYLGQLESGELDYKIWEIEEISVRLYGSMAVIRYVDSDFVIFVNGELAKSGKLKHRNLYEKRNGQWQIVWSRYWKIN